MGKILAVGSNKGGVGKTTTVVNLAVLFTVLYKLRVVIIKSDKNPDLLDWNTKRMAAGLTPIPIHEAYGRDVYKEIQRIQKLVDLVIVDCPGHDSAEFRSALTVADTLITLVKPSSSFETGTLREVTEAVRKAQNQANGNPALKPWVLMTRIKPNKIPDAIELEKELKSNEVWIQPLKTRLSDLDVYEGACNLGAGVHEITRGPSLTKAKALLELLVRELNLSN